MIDGVYEVEVDGTLKYFILKDGVVVEIDKKD